MSAPTDAARRSTRRLAAVISPLRRMLLAAPAPPSTCPRSRTRRSRSSAPCPAASSHRRANSPTGSGEPLDGEQPAHGDGGPRPRRPRDRRRRPSPCRGAGLRAGARRCSSASTTPAPARRRGDRHPCPPPTAPRSPPRSPLSSACATRSPHSAADLSAARERTTAIHPHPQGGGMTTLRQRLTRRSMHARKGVELGPYEITIERDLRVPMDDGVELLADLIRPSATTSRRCRPSSSAARTAAADCSPARRAPLAYEGFTVLFQSCRGTWGSARRLHAADRRAARRHRRRSGGCGAAVVHRAARHVRAELHGLHAVGGRRAMQREEPENAPEALVLVDDDARLRRDHVGQRRLRAAQRARLDPHDAPDAPRRTRR